MHHLGGEFQEARDIDAHDRRRNHAEIRERGVAAADRRQAEEDVAEVVGLGDVLHLRPGVGDGDETVGSAARALEEILLEDVGLERAAGLAGDDEERLGEIDLALDGADLRGIGGVEHMQLGESGNRAEGHAHDFGAEAGAAHAQEQRVFETAGAHLRGDVLEVLDVGDLVVDDSQPADPLGLVGAAPQRGVAAPQAAGFVVGLPVGERGLDRGGQFGGELGGLAVDLGGSLAGGLEQRFESRGELLDTVVCQFVRDLFHGDAGLGEGFHGVLRGFQVFHQAGARSAVVAEGVEGGGRNGVDGVRADQLFDVHDVAVAGVLGAGAGPQQALGLGAFGGQRGPALACSRAGYSNGK